MSLPFNPSRREELANTLTHGFGLLASVAGGAVMITLTAIHGNAWQIVSASIFSASLIFLYVASSLHHGITSPKAKYRLLVLDHCAIYVLIAGTYTPFTLVTLQGPWGWSLFGVIWGLAAVGIGLKLFFTGRFELVSTLIYVAMGWLIVVAFKPLLGQLSLTALVLLVAGGVAYTLGTYFFLNTRMRYAHTIWHLFVLLGSALHFMAVWTQVLP